MYVNRRFFPEVMNDNELVYFAHLEGILSSVDELCSLEIVKNPHSYAFRIAPSAPKYAEMLLKEILKFHNMFQIKLNMSKSMKTSANIVFEINLDDN